MRARGRAIRGHWLTRLSRDGRALLVMALLAVLFSFDVGHTQSYVLVLSVVSLLSASVLLTRAFRVAGVMAELRFAPRVAVGEDLAVHVHLANRSDRRYGRLRIELPSSSVAKFGPAPFDLPELAPHEERTAALTARFATRGRFELGPFRAALVLPLGLAQGAPLRTSVARVIVVPKIARVESLSTWDTRASHQATSARARNGDTRDLLGVRPYRPGDAIRDLHARSWARHGIPMVREYQEPKTARVGVVLDTRSWDRDKAHFEGAVSLAAGVLAKLSSGDATLDLILAGAEVVSFELGSGTRALHAGLDRLADVAAAVGSSFGMPELSARASILARTFVITLAPGDASAALGLALRSAGANAQVVALGETSLQGAHVAVVAHGSMIRGEPIAL